MEITPIMFIAKWDTFDNIIKFIASFEKSFLD